MRLKTFQAKTMTEAMRQIKEALGDDAIIVSSKQAPGGWMRVTAAIDEEFDAAPVFEKPDFGRLLAAEKARPPAPAKPAASTAKPTATQGEKYSAAQGAGAYAAMQKTKAAPAKPAAPEGFDEEEVLEMITDVMLKHRVPGSVSEKIIGTASVLTGRDPRATLARALEKTFTFLPPPKRQAEPVLLVGPPGAGKTLMTAKLAARAVMAGQTPAVITTDIARAGGVEQLSAFLDIMELNLLQAEDAKSLKAAIAKAKDAPLVIIDTGGLNPFDPQEMKFLAQLMATEPMDSALVFPAGLDAEESAEMAMTFEILGVRRIIPTRLDFARRIGGILSAADKGNLAFGQASHTAQVADGILDITPHSLAEFLLPTVPPKDIPKKGR
ncbi:MAG: ATP-binding protein [Micavibrio sp.]|nr:ATP-binding protein [Micavibrio sp.]